MVTSKINKKFFAILLFGIFLAGGGLTWWFMYDGGGETLPSTENHTYWREQIRANGAPAAYEEFAASVREYSRGWQHENAHTFGGALYQEMGTKGLTTCDSQFDYGCFHEFLGRAIAELGIRSVEELNKTCIEMLGDNAGFCQHGLGHGIQSYFGYADADFFEAVAVCGDLPDNDPIGGCIGGIFMEYNLRSMLADDRVIRESDDLQYPCNVLEGQYVPACYFWQPQWWYEGVIQEEEKAEEIFAELGKRCEAVTAGEQMKELCFGGIGNIVQRGDTRGSNQACDFVSEDERYREMCWEFDSIK